VIERYLTELDARLVGPARRKADLLTEARDGLTDAAEAYSAAGLDEADAQRRAVAEFGELSMIAREYQSELGIVAGIRALHTMMIAIPASQGLFNLTRMVWFGDWSNLASPTPSWYPVFARINDYGCVAAAVLGVLALVTTRLLGRWFSSARVARFAATTLAIGACGHFLALGALLVVTGMVDIGRLYLNLPCGAVAVLCVAVSVRLVVLAGRTWRACVTIVQ
jgi:hypothetical protein